MMVLYGIRNCDTMKKARAWLDGHDVAYRFHDFKRDGLDAPLLTAWVDALGWEALVNRRGTTWRRLSESERESIDRDSAIHLMLANPSLIRRPVLDLGSELKVGFAAESYEALIR